MPTFTEKCQELFQRMDRQWPWPLRNDSAIASSKIEITLALLTEIQHLEIRLSAARQGGLPGLGNITEVLRLEQRLQTLRDAHQYSTSHGADPEVVAHLRAVLLGGDLAVQEPSTLAPRLPTRRTPIDVLLYNLEQPQQTIRHRVYERQFTTDHIVDFLRKKRRLSCGDLPHGISPRLYVKYINKHQRTPDGTQWDLVRHNGRLTSRELYVVPKSCKFALVLLGHEGRSDSTLVVDVSQITMAPPLRQFGTLRWIQTDEEVGIPIQWPLEPHYYCCHVYGRI